MKSDEKANKSSTSHLLPVPNGLYRASFSIGVPVKPTNTAFWALNKRPRSFVSCAPYCVCVRTRLWASSMSTTCPP